MILVIYGWIIPLLFLMISDDRGLLKEELFVYIVIV